MRFSSGKPSRVWLQKDSPYRDLIVVGLCIGGAALALASLQSLNGPAPPSTAVETPAPGGPATGPAALPVPPAPALRPKTAKPRPPSAPAGPASATPRFPSVQEIEEEILRLTNEERASRGLPLLAHDTALDAIARAHSRDMVARDFFSHENPSGDGPTKRAEKAGYDVHKPVQGGELVGIGENIGMTPIGLVEDIGFVERAARSIATAQVRGWMSTRGHRANILSEDYERVGVGAAFNGSGAYVCTQVFW